MYINLWKTKQLYSLTHQVIEFYCSQKTNQQQQSTDIYTKICTIFTECFNGCELYISILITRNLLYFFISIFSCLDNWSEFCTKGLRRLKDMGLSDLFRKMLFFFCFDLGNYVSLSIRFWQYLLYTEDTFSYCFTLNNIECSTIIIRTYSGYSASRTSFK